MARSARFIRQPLAPVPLVRALEGPPVVKRAGVGGAAKRACPLGARPLLPHVLWPAAGFATLGIVYWLSWPRCCRDVPGPLWRGPRPVDGGVGGGAHAGTGDTRSRGAVWSRQLPAGAGRGHLGRTRTDPECGVFWWGGRAGLAWAVAAPACSPSLVVAHPCGGRWPRPAAWRCGWAHCVCVCVALCAKTHKTGAKWAGVLGNWALTVCYHATLGRSFPRPALPWRGLWPAARPCACRCSPASGCRGGCGGASAWCLDPHDVKMKRTSHLGQQRDPAHPRVRARAVPFIVQRQAV